MQELSRVLLLVEDHLRSIVLRHLVNFQFTILLIFTSRIDWVIRYLPLRLLYQNFHNNTHIYRYFHMFLTLFCLNKWVFGQLVSNPLLLEDNSPLSPNFFLCYQSLSFSLIGNLAFIPFSFYGIIISARPRSSMDRVPDFESVGCAFESRRGRYI